MKFLKIVTAATILAANANAVVGDIPGLMGAVQIRHKKDGQSICVRSPDYQCYTDGRPKCCSKKNGRNCPSYMTMCDNYPEGYTGWDYCTRSPDKKCYPHSHGRPACCSKKGGGTMNCPKQMPGCENTAVAYEVPEDNLIADPADEYDAEMNAMFLETEPESSASEDTDLYDKDEDLESFDENEDEEDKDEDVLEMMSSALELGNDQCDQNQPSHTSAHPYGRNYMFTREMNGFVGGPIPSSKCSAPKTVQKNTQSADDCASACASDDASRRSSSDVLLGYNYNCHTKKCDCIRGGENYDLDSHYRTDAGYWTCYKSDTATPPAPTPPEPAECLPASVTGSGFGTTYTFGRVDPQQRNTSCNVGQSFLPSTVDSVGDCADNCASMPNVSSGVPGSKKLIGFDYNCDSKQCTCLLGNSGTNLRQTVQLTNQNMACYFIVGDAMTAKKNLRAN